MLATQQAKAWDLNVGTDLTGYTMTFQSYGTSTDATLQKVKPHIGGLGSYTSITVPENATYYLTYYSITAIGDEAFKGLSEMKEVKIEYGTKTIGRAAFQDCTGLKSITLPSSVRTISPDAFKGCTGLQELTLPSNLEILCSGAFAGCSSLHSITYNSTSPASCIEFSDLPDDCVLHIPYGMEEAYAAKGWTTDVFKGGIVAETLVKEDGLTYSLTGETTAAVIGCSEGLANANVKETIRLYSQGTNKYYTVTGVGEGAFENCTSLQSITLPSTITTVGDRAFAGCSGLTAMNVAMTTAPSVTASVFTGIVKANCKLYVPKGKTSAYSSWRPYFATVVDGETFKETINGVETTFLITGETTVQLGDGAVAITTDFAGAYPIPETVEHEGVTYTVTAIGAYAFNGCTRLTGEMIIPSTVTYIGAYAFYRCSEITKAEIPYGVKALPQYTFYGCTKLASVSLPEGLELILGNALYGCSSLQTLEIPSTVNLIWQKALYGALTTLTAKMLSPCGMEGSVFESTSACKLIVPQGTRDAYISKGWTEDVFTGGVVEDGQLWGYTEEGVRFTARVIEDNNVQIFNGDEEGPNGPAIDINTTGPVTLPASFEYLGQTYYVKEIGRNAFYQCKGITSVIIPEGVTKVSKWAFLQCNALESVTLPTTLTEIGEFAFRECKLSSVELPENLIALGQQAFCKNENLTTITLPASLTDIGSDVFSNTNLLSVIALGINPAPLQNESAFWPDQTKLNPVILTVPYGTRQRYLDAGYTESTETTIGAVYKIVEQPVEKNHTFLQVGEGAEIYLEYYDAIGNRQDRQLTPGNTFSAYITNNNIQAANSEEEIAHNLQVFLTPGYTLTKLLRNGRDVTDLYQTYYGTEDGTTAIKFELKDVDINAYQKLSMDDNDVTWMIYIEDEESTKPVNPYDANGDGSITIADVTKLVNIILGKDHSYEPQDIELEYDVRMKPSNTYGEIEVPIAQAICDAFALSAAEIAEKTCSSIPPTPERGEIGLYWYNPNEPREIIPYTANTGYWFNASGTPCSWSDDGALTAAEFNKAKGCFVLSQYPNRNQAGDAREMRIMFLYHNDFDKYGVVGITFHVTFSDDADNTATLR
jgi:hypothetical protein